jgi:hypothetical protein
MKKCPCCAGTRHDEVFVIADEDVTFPRDPAPNAGLDDWEF